MKIQSINNFRSSIVTNRLVYNKQIPTFCCGTTEFLREDFDIDGIINLASSLHKDVDKVNSYFYACSNGKEVYSFNLKLKSLLKDGANKYYPLIAKDLNPAYVLKAKRGVYSITDSEDEKLSKAMNTNLYRYIDISSDGYEKIAFIKDSLKSDISFSQANICDDIDKIPYKESLIFVRNFWGYLSAEEQVNLANKLSKSLKEKSLVIIGSFDKALGIDRLLLSRKFVKSEIPNVFIKLARNI